MSDVQKFEKWVSDTGCVQISGHRFSGEHQNSTPYLYLYCESQRWGKCVENIAKEHNDILDAKARYEYTIMYEGWRGVVKNIVIFFKRNWLRLSNE